jgi:hypothetical protein
LFFCFLEETSAWKNHFDFFWPLVDVPFIWIIWLRCTLIFSIALFYSAKPMLHSFVKYAGWHDKLANFATIKAHRDVGSRLACWAFAHLVLKWTKVVKLIANCTFAMNCLPIQKWIASYAPRGKCVPCAFYVTLFAFRYHKIFFYLPTVTKIVKKYAVSFLWRGCNTIWYVKKGNFLAENMAKTMTSYKEI